jgi:hypothetical protein
MARHRGWVPFKATSLKRKGNALRFQRVYESWGAERRREIRSRRYRWVCVQ